MLVNLSILLLVLVRIEICSLIFISFWFIFYDIFTNLSFGFLHNFYKLILLYLSHFHGNFFLSISNVFLRTDSRWWQDCWVDYLNSWHTWSYFHRIIWVIWCAWGFFLFGYSCVKFRGLSLIFTILWMRLMIFIT